MPRIATPSSLARVAIPVLALAAVTSCTTGTPAASPTPVAGAASSGPGAVPSAASGPSERWIGELPGHWYIDVQGDETQGPAR